MGRAVAAEFPAPAQGPGQSRCPEHRMGDFRLSLHGVRSISAGQRRHLLIKVHQCPSQRLSKPVLSPYYGDIHHPSLSLKQPRGS